VKVNRLSPDSGGSFPSVGAEGDGTLPSVKVNRDSVEWFSVESWDDSGES
jgi:hypothetical protein